MFEQLGDALGDQEGIQGRVGDGQHGEFDLLVGQHLRQIFLQGFDTGAFLTDDFTGLAGAQDQFDAVFGAFDFDAGQVGLVEFLKQEFTDLQVFHQKRTEVFFSIPAGFPVTDDPDAHANRIYFLSHVDLLVLFRHDHGDVAGAFEDGRGRSFGPRHEALQRDAFIGVTGFNEELLFR